MTLKKVRFLLSHLCLMAGFLLLLIPTSLKLVVKQIGVDPHPVSFFIGPALYSYSSKLIPNVDYFTQYGTGLGALFFYFLKDSPSETFKAVVLVTLLGTIFFTLTFYLLAQWLLDSKIWSFLLVLIALLLNFYGPSPLRAPSGWPVRYAFLALFCLVFAGYLKYYRTRLQKPMLLFLGIVAGISFFWVTEIGLYTILIGIFCLWLSSKEKIDAIRTPLLFMTISFSTFLALSILAFGIHSLSFNFIIGVFKPAMLYGSGFGAWPINWLSPLEFLFNTLIPILLATTVIWIISSNASPAVIMPQEKKHLLLLVALLGLAQLTKYWNMALAAVWFSNSYFPLLVLCFWLRLGINALSNQLANSFKTLVRNALTPVILSVGIFFIVAFHDSRMDTEYGYQMYKQYPSLLMGLFKHSISIPKSVIPFSAVEVDDLDVKLIDKLIPVNESAYILSSRDWVYLLRAKRAPGFPFVPSTMTPLRELGEGWHPLLNAQIIFIDSGQSVWGGNSELTAFIMQRIQSEYVLDSVGKDLTAYKRRDIA